MGKSPSKPTVAYLLSISVILLASIYPIYMGAKVMSAFIRDGQIDVSDYPKYIIPYTPICIAVILAAALVPFAARFLKKLSLPALSALGTCAFVLSEILFEQMTVFDGSKTGNIGSWQSFLCIATPEVLQTIEYRSTIGKELTARYNPVFKVHFYLIAILIVLTVMGIAHGFYTMYKSEHFGKRRPLITQTISTAVFISLSIFACFTAFYRTGDINISALSSWLMSLFFIVFGVTAGSYAGGVLFGKRPLFSRWVPAITAGLTTTAMYIGELILMGGVLFKFGEGFLFEPMGFIAFAPVDVFVILLSGGVTYLLLRLIRKRDRAIII